LSRELQDGLMIDSSVYIIDEKKSGFPISARVFQMIAIVIGVWSSVSVFIECLAIPVNLLQVDLAILLFAGILFSICLIPSYDIVKLFFGVLFYCLFFYSRFHRIQNGFYIIENLVLDRIGSYYGYHSMQFIADYTMASEDTTLIIFMLIIPMIALMTVAIVRSRFVNLSSLVLFIPVSVSFAFGIIPSERYLITYVAAVLYLSRSGFSFRHIVNKDQKTLIHRINSRAAVWLSLMGICIFLILKLFVTEQRYDGITEIEDMKSKIQNKLYSFSLEDVSDKFSDFTIKRSKISIGGLSGGELGDTGEVKFTNSEQLQITAPLPSINEGIYLKGYVGTVYTGDSWEGHTKSDEKKYKELLKTLPTSEFAPVNQTNLLLSMVIGEKSAAKNADGLTIFNNMQGLSYYQVSQGKLEIKYKAANKKFIYAPYFTNYELINQARYEQDLYLAPVERKNKYEFDYYFNLSLGDQPSFYMNWMDNFSGNYQKQEKLYRNYVYQVYTRLPEKGIDRIKQDFSKQSVEKVALTVPEKIEYVKNYLAANTSYSLSPGKLPKDEDFVEYFLYTNKIGYCAHYASAATLMLRAMGIPARYIEGYAVSASDINQTVLNESQKVTTYSEIGLSSNDVPQVDISVKDYNAHAWVEVYIDGCGWIPVEVTPGSSINYNNSVVNNISRFDQYDDEEEEQITPTVTPQTPTPTVKEEDEEYEAKTPKPSNVPTQKTIQYKKEQARLDKLFLGIFICLVIIAISITIILKIRSGQRKMRTKNFNKKAILLFAEIEKILSFCHNLPKKGTCLEDSEEYVKENCAYIDPAGFDTLMDIVKRARFGRGKISRKEMEKVELFHRNLYDNVYRELPFGKKVFLKLILFL
jgi:protein-glutamine gamma-glutamyltransferase